MKAVWALVTLCATAHAQFYDFSPYHPSYAFQFRQTTPAPYNIQYTQQNNRAINKNNRINNVFDVNIPFASFVNSETDENNFNTHTTQRTQKRKPTNVNNDNNFRKPINSNNNDVLDSYTRNPVNRETTRRTTTIRSVQSNTNNNRNTNNNWNLNNNDVLDENTRNFNTDVTTKRNSINRVTTTRKPNEYSYTNTNNDNNRQSNTNQNNNRRTTTSNNNQNQNNNNRRQDNNIYYYETDKSTNDRTTESNKQTTNNYNRQSGNRRTTKKPDIDNIVYEDNKNQYGSFPDSSTQSASIPFYNWPGVKPPIFHNGPPITNRPIINNNRNPTSKPTFNRTPGPVTGIQNPNQGSNGNSGANQNWNSGNLNPGSNWDSGSGNRNWNSGSNQNTNFGSNHDFQGSNSNQGSNQNYPGSNQNSNAGSFKPSVRNPSNSSIHIPFTLSIPGEGEAPPLYTFDLDVLSDEDRRKLDEEAEELCSAHQQQPVVEAIPLLPSPSPVAVPVSRCAEANPLIVGGHKVPVAHVPHQAALGWRHTNGSLSWRCGGVLVSSLVVITAAHCAYQDRDNSISIGPPTMVCLGSSFLGQGKQIPVKEALRLSQYRPPASYRDTAALVLSLRATFSDSIRPACVGSLPRPGDDVYASGWGRTEYGGDTSSVLRGVSLSVWSAEECAVALGQSRRLPSGVRPQWQYCAGSRQGRGDTCQGDSGGGVGVRLRCVWRISGLTSLGRACGSQTPAIYARLWPHFVAAAQRRATA